MRPAWQSIIFPDGYAEEDFKRIERFLTAERQVGGDLSFQFTRPLASWLDYGVRMHACIERTLVTPGLSSRPNIWLVLDYSIEGYYPKNYIKHWSRYKPTGRVITEEKLNALNFKSYEKEFFIVVGHITVKHLPISYHKYIPE